MTHFLPVVNEPTPGGCRVLCRPKVNETRIKGVGFTLNVINLVWSYNYVTYRAIHREAGLRVRRRSRKRAVSRLLGFLVYRGGLQE